MMFDLLFSFPIDLQDFTLKVASGRLLAYGTKSIEIDNYMSYTKILETTLKIYVFNDRGTNFTFIDEI